MPSWARIVIFLAIFVCTTGFDQASKDWARTLPTSPPGCTAADLAGRRCVGVPQPVIEGTWDWQLAMNDGVAFSTFTGVTGGQILLSILASIGLVAIGIVAKRTRPDQHLKRVALALIAGGALGNLIDRIRDGAVTDFVRWRFGSHVWPLFNVADTALIAGAFLLLIEEALAKRKRGSPPQAALGA